MLICTIEASNDKHDITLVQVIIIQPNLEQVEHVVVNIVVVAIVVQTIMEPCKTTQEVLITVVDKAVDSLHIT